MVRSIGLAGMIGSGKTTVAQVLVRDHGYQSLSFGVLVRDHARLLNLDPMDRSVLQRVGSDLHDTLGAGGLVTALLSRDSARPIVVEGIRHLDVAVALRKSVRDIFLVFVDSRVVTVKRRVTERGDSGGLQLALDHSVESELPAVRDECDLVIETDDLSVSEIVFDLLKVSRE